MKIAEVEISNFRTLYEAKIKFYNVTSFVGPNGVGKSTVLYALDWFFNGGRAGMLTPQDATYGHEQENIEVRVTFDDLNDNDRAVLGKYVNAEVNTFTAWKIRTFADGNERLSANIKGYNLFTDLKVPNIAVSDLKEKYKNIQLKYPELQLKNATTKKSILDELNRWESDNPDKLTNVPEELTTNFNGFNSNDALASRFKFTLVRADLRANEEASDSRNSLLSEIIERAVDRKSADDRLINEFKTIQQNEKNIYDDVFGEPLKKLTCKFNKVVSGYNTNRSVEIQPNIQEINPPKTTFTIKVNDGENQTPVTKQGHGFQRTVLISALQLLSEKDDDNANDNGVLCLAIEEPELFQHPIQAQVFASVLRKLADKPSNDVQVTYATHSPYFLEEKHFEQIYRLIRHSNGTSYSTKIFHASMSEVIDDLERYSAQDRQKKKEYLEKLYSNDLPIGIYANEVILVEGSTDKAILESISEKMVNVSLAQKGIVIISCGSKSKIPQYYAILKGLGIPTSVVFDNDSGWGERSDKTGETREKVKQAHISENNKIVRFLGLENDLEDNDFPDPGTHQQTFIVDDTLEPYLEKNWKGWAEAYDRAVSELNPSSKKNAELYTQTIRALSIENCPAPLSSFLETVNENC